MSFFAFRDLRPPPFLTKVLNGPLPRRTPFAALRDYYDDHTLQYLFSVGNGLGVFDSTTSTRLLKGLALDHIRRRFQTRRTLGAPVGLPAPAAFAFHFRQQVDATFEQELFAASTAVSFDTTYHKFQALFWRSVHAKCELGGHLLFDPQSKRIGFEEVSVSSSLNNTVGLYAAGETYRGKLVLASVHTHPGELPFLKKFSDEAIFLTQYSTPSGDGRSAVFDKTSKYALGRFNVDFFSAHGQAASKNNISTLINLDNGSFNIYQHALEVYGNRRK